MTESDPAAGDDGPRPAEVGGAPGEEDGAHRLHPLSVLFHLLAGLKNLALPVLVLVFASSEGAREELLFGLAIVPSTIYSLFHYLTYRYRFDGDEMVVRGGVLFRFERHIPYDRVHNIDLSQGPLQRLLGVAEVRVETGSGGEAEARMSVLTLQAVEDMRARIFAGRARLGADGAAVEVGVGGDGRGAASWGSGTTEASVGAAGLSEPVGPGATLVRLEPLDLVAFGLLSNRGLAVMLAVLGLLWEAGLAPDDLDEGLMASVPEAQLSPWIYVPVLALSLFLLLKLLSVVWALVKLWGFTLERRGDDLQVRCGLLTRHAATIPRRRIQVVTVSASLLQRWTGRVAVKVDTAGGSSLEESAASRRWIAPLLPEEDLPALLKELLPDVDLAGVAWLPVHPRAGLRRVRLHGLVGLAAAGLLAWWWPWWGAWAAPAIVLACILDGWLRVRRRRWALDTHAVFARSGVWTHEQRIVRHPKIQTVRMGETPFDRRWGMARVRIDVAGSMKGLVLRDLPAAEAARAAEALAHRAAATAFQW